MTIIFRAQVQGPLMVWKKWPGHCTPKLLINDCPADKVDFTRSRNLRRTLVACSILLFILLGAVLLTSLLGSERLPARELLPPLLRWPFIMRAYSDQFAIL